MSSLYAMQRANGDWYALDDKGLLRMPVFQNSSAAMHARSSNWGMFLFKPMVFDKQASKELASEEGGGNLYFWLVDEPFVNIGRGRVLDQTQLDLLITKAPERTRQ